MLSARDVLTDREPSRRSFLKSSAGLASAAALGTLTLERSAHAAGNDQIRIGMIGCGGRCTGAAAQSLRAGPDVRLVAMCDLFDDRVQSSRKTLAAQLPEQIEVNDDHCFVGFEGYQHVIDSVDVVLIACASKFHPMYSEAAIRAGKHVFVEKPHGIDPEGMHRMQAACDLAKEKGLSLVSGLQSRFHRGWQETVQRIHDGAIGDIVAVQSMFLRGPYQVIERQPEWSETEYQFRNWYHFCWLSGDDVTQSLVHNVDRISWILKEEMPTWAFGLAGRSSSFGDPFGDMFDHHTAVYEYESGTRLYALCRTQNGCYGNSNDLIMGSRGQCDLGRCRIEGENAWRYDGPGNDPYLDEQAALIESVRSGKPTNSGPYMVNSTRVAVMGQIACYTGTRTEWENVEKSTMRFGPTPEESNFDTPPPTRPDATGNYPLPQPGITKLLY